MKKSNTIIFLSLLIGIFVIGFSIYSSVFAVGGGAGGSVPTCTEDVWTCGEWSTCSAAGKQTRNCQLSFDCETASTPSPAVEGACTPATPPAPVPPSDNPQGPESPQNSGKSESCTEDVWTCSSWSKACDVNGNQNRTCRLTSDCPAADTPPPLTQQKCDHLQCGAKPELHDRIACRLNLAPAGIARELQLQYLPEECRAMASDKDKEVCEERYKSYESCWNLPAGESRFQCARSVLKLGPLVSDEVKTCQGKTGTARVACENEVKDKVFSMVKFRFYDLEQRAEKLGERGADLGAIADLETLIEQKKQAFDRATSLAERRQIILDVRQAWQAFISKVKDQVK